MMADNTPKLTVTDPDNVPETLCLGRFNLQFAGRIGILTLTHVRKRAADTFTELTTESAEEVVRARIAMPIEGFLQLRDMLNRAVEPEAAPAGSAASN